MQRKRALRINVYNLPIEIMALHKILKDKELIKKVIDDEEYEKVEKEEEEEDEKT